MRNYPIIDSIGLEVETELMIQGNLPLHLRQYWHEDHDASIESYGYQKNGLLYNKPIPNGRKIKLGSEIVSGVMDSTSERTNIAIKQLLGWIAENGETQESFRAGIHVHICMPNKLGIQKNLINLAAYLEQVFFYIGGMGYEHRGIQNNFTYCRPITKYGPSCVKYGRDATQCFKIEELLNAISNEHFWDMYGGINPDNPPNKYIPQRYTWFTLYPLLTKGTVEFRIFNKTLNFYFLRAAIRLCQEVCSFSLNNNVNLPENSIYSPHTKDSVLNTLSEFSLMVGLDSGTVNTLIKIIQRTPQIIIKPEYYWTHLMFTKFNRLETLNWRNHSPQKIKRDGILVPKFVDIHNLNERPQPLEEEQNVLRINNPFNGLVMPEFRPLNIEVEEVEELIFDEDID